MAITMAAMRFAFGQWPDNDDKHDMSEAASEYAKEVVAMASQTNSTSHRTEGSALHLRHFLASPLDTCPITLVMQSIKRN